MSNPPHAMTRTTHQPDAPPGNVNDVLDALERVVRMMRPRRRKGWPYARVKPNANRPNREEDVPAGDELAAAVKFGDALLERWGR